MNTLLIIDLDLPTERVIIFHTEKLAREAQRVLCQSIEGVRSVLVRPLPTSTEN